LVKVSTAALKAGVEERRVRLAEKQGQLVAGVIRRVLVGMLEQLLATGIAATLRKVWQASVVEIVTRELRALAAGGGASWRATSTTSRGVGGSSGSPPHSTSASPRRPRLDGVTSAAITACVPSSGTPPM